MNGIFYRPLKKSKPATEEADVTLPNNELEGDEEERIKIRRRERKRKRYLLQLELLKIEEEEDNELLDKNKQK